MRAGSLRAIYLGSGPDPPEAGTTRGPGEAGGRNRSSATDFGRLTWIRQQKGQDTGAQSLVLSRDPRRWGLISNPLFSTGWTLRRENMERALRIQIPGPGKLK